MMKPVSARMLKVLCLCLASLCLPVASCLAAPLQQAEPSDMAQAIVATPTTGQTEYAYGADSLQRLDFWPAIHAKPAPLIVFVHGGGWKQGDKQNATGAEKLAHFLKNGYAFASINYRLVPAATVEQQAADVSAALAWLHSHAKRLDIDTSRIILMGHSAGAHLVALVGTDPRYLSAAGLALSDLRGVIALDGAAYDVARQISDSGIFMRRTYLQAFGSDVARQRALSPTLQAAAPNAPAFLLLHIDRPDGKAQTEALAAALSQAGAAVEVDGLAGKGLRGHMEINRALGNPDFPATAVVDTWLNKLLDTK